MKTHLLEIGSAMVVAAALIVLTMTIVPNSLATQFMEQVAPQAVPISTHDEPNREAMAIALPVMTDGAISHRAVIDTSSDMSSDISGQMIDICTSDNVYGVSEALTGANHAHPLINVKDDLPQPSVQHLVLPDSKDGYNIQILTQNFAFTPARINDDNRDNEGHAHIYINGEKIARVYGHWYHVPSSLLQTGMNVISVTLNANDHSEWAIDNVPITSNVRVVKPDAQNATMSTTQSTIQGTIQVKTES